MDNSILEANLLPLTNIHQIDNYTINTIQTFLSKKDKFNLSYKFYLVIEWCSHMRNYDTNNEIVKGAFNQYLCNLASIRNHIFHTGFDDDGHIQNMVYQNIDNKLIIKNHILQKKVPYELLCMGESSDYYHEDLKWQYKPADLQTVLYLIGEYLIIGTTGDYIPQEIKM